MKALLLLALLFQYRPTPQTPDQLKLGPDCVSYSNENPPSRPVQNRNRLPDIPMPAEDNRVVNIPKDVYASICSENGGVSITFHSREVRTLTPFKFQFALSKGDVTIKSAFYQFPAQSEQTEGKPVKEFRRVRSDIVGHIFPAEKMVLKRTDGSVVAEGKFANFSLRGQGKWLVMELLKLKSFESLKTEIAAAPEEPEEKK